jgi:hypothetical protein
MSPTVLKWRGYRFFFFSRKEARAHVHVHCGDGQMKVWLVPDVSVAASFGLSGKQVTAVVRFVEAHRDEILAVWNQHFRG